VSKHTGGGEEKKSELCNRLREKEISAACLSETWQCNSIEMEENGECLIIHNGNRKPEKGRAKGGVAIVLSPKIARLWKKGGSVVRRPHPIRA
jgi:hypothetical protein